MDSVLLNVCAKHLLKYHGVNLLIAVTDDRIISWSKSEQINMPLPIVYESDDHDVKILFIKKTDE